MLNGGAHHSFEVEAELRIRPLMCFQRRERAHHSRKARPCSHQALNNLRGRVRRTGEAAPPLHARSRGFGRAVRKGSPCFACPARRPRFFVLVRHFVVKCYNFVVRTDFVGKAIICRR
jgi:hypothetical protein